MERDIQGQTLIQNILNEIPSLDGSQLETIYQAIQGMKHHSDERFHNLGKILGIEWGEDGEAYMLLGSFNSNTYGVTQGGALYTLADVAIGYKILNRLEENQKVFTLEMKMNFIKKGQGTKLTTKADIIHWGRKSVVAECKIFDETGDVVAQSLGTFFISHASSNQPSKGE